MVAIKALGGPGKSVVDLSTENRLKCWCWWTEEGQTTGVNVSQGDISQKESGARELFKCRFKLEFRSIIWVVELRVSVGLGTVCSLN